LDELVRVLEYDQGKDRLVFCGDLVDRGPDPVGVVRRVQELGAESVMGNHEEKHVRWAKWEHKVRSGQADRNPMRPFSEKRLSEHNALSEDDMAFVLAMPKMLRLECNWLVVHAGFECDGTPPEDQDLSRICRVRDLDADGKMAVNKKDFFQAAEGSEPWDLQWAKKYGRNPGVVYGHAVHSLTEPRAESLACYGIDTGCVYGGRLTAWFRINGNYNFDPRDDDGRRIYPGRVSTVDYVQVEARRQYFRPPDGWRVGRPTSSLD
jgi:hypothetical protein